MLKIFTLCFLISITFTSTWANAYVCDMQNHKITINSDSEHPVDFQLICESSAKAILFFEQYGYTGRSLDITVNIKDNVYVPGYDARKGEETKDKFQTFGYYNGGTDEIVITNYGSDYLNNRKAWLAEPGNLHKGLDLDKTFWASVITHEMAHAYLNLLWREREINRNLEKNGIPLGSGAHEYVAYTAQIWSLPQSHKEKIMNMYKGKLYEDMDRLGLSALRHYSFPHLYGASSYFSFNPLFLVEIIEGKLDNDRAFTSGVL